MSGRLAVIVAAFALAIAGAGAAQAVPSPQSQVGDGSECNAAHFGWTLSVYVAGHVPPYAHYVCLWRNDGGLIVWYWAFQYWSYTR